MTISVTMDKESQYALRSSLDIWLKSINDSKDSAINSLKNAVSYLTVHNLVNKFSLDDSKQVIDKIIKDLNIVGFPRMDFIVPNGLGSNSFFNDLKRVGDSLMGGYIETDLPGLEIAPYFGATRSAIGLYALMPGGLVAFDNLMRINNKDYIVLDSVVKIFDPDDYKYVINNLPGVINNYLKQ